MSEIALTTSPFNKSLPSFLKNKLENTKMVNVSQESGAFFQTDAEIAKQREKAAKYNYTAGDAVKLASKALSICLSPDGKYIYIAESGFQVRKMTRSVSFHFLSHTRIQKANLT